MAGFWWIDCILHSTFLVFRWPKALHNISQHSPNHRHIHILMASVFSSVPTCSSGNHTNTFTAIGSNLGFIILPKDTYTCTQTVRVGNWTTDFLISRWPALPPSHSQPFANLKEFFIFSLRGILNLSLTCRLCQIAHVQGNQITDELDETQYFPHESSRRVPYQCHIFAAWLKTCNRF